ncbi:hypothetical protein Tco_0384008, partial [Tanacetum coccineum]
GSVSNGLLQDLAVTYTSVHSEAARQLLEQALRSPEYVPADHVPVYIPKPEHPEDLRNMGPGRVTS